MTDIYARFRVGSTPYFVSSHEFLIRCHSSLGNGTLPDAAITPRKILPTLHVPLRDDLDASVDRDQRRQDRGYLFLPAPPFTSLGFSTFFRIRSALA